MEEAIECYKRAGNMFKMSKNWTKAGECFCEAANLHARSGSRHDAGTSFVDASNCYKKVNTDDCSPKNKPRFFKAKLYSL